MNKTSTFIIILLLVVIAILSWVVFAKPVVTPVTPVTITPSPTNPVPVTTTPPSPSPAPLHSKIQVTYPKANTSVPKKFTITGKAPGNWFFEASAPYMIRIEDGSKVAQGTLQTIGNWQTTNLVDFKADVVVNPAFSGQATLVLMKDNPSGLPENDDSLEIPITIQ